MQDASQWLNEYLGLIPLFGGELDRAAARCSPASIVLAIMILPIIAAISREVFLQVPRMHEEAALALGATRWEVIRIAVLPFGRPGVISASMLGLGRAHGRDHRRRADLRPRRSASASRSSTPHGNSIAANIANGFGEATPIGRGALIASGLVLFVITLLVNIAARMIVARRKESREAAA